MANKKDNQRVKITKKNYKKYISRYVRGYGYK